jgi:hypothetical protein
MARAGSRRLMIAALICATGVAHADGRTGVVVTGDAKLQAPLAAAVETWLRAHGRETVATPLDPDAINSIVDCFVIEDQACARAVIDKRAKAEGVVYARIEAAPTKRSSKDVTIAAWWFVKGHDPVAERRVCERCTPETIRATADAMLKALASATDTQKPTAELAQAEPPPPPPPPPPVIAAPPPPPPVATPVPPPQLPSPSPTPDRTLPIAVGAVGGAALITGLILMMHDDDGSAPTYRDTKPAGVVVGLAGLGLIGFDVYLWLHGAHRESGPTVAATPHGAVLGWVGRF